jgi:hypothetical protein
VTPFEAGLPSLGAALVLIALGPMLLFYSLPR